MSLPIRTSLKPMEARAVDQIPKGTMWQYEPKWDGFRCLVFRDGPKVLLQSKSGQPLARYFPDLVERLLHLRLEKFVLDGEIVIPVGDQFSFDQLLQRIHPATTRVSKLADQYPAMFIAFDLLIDMDGSSLIESPLADRRKALVAFARKYMGRSKFIRLSPATQNIARARRWFSAKGANLDGIIAKQVYLPYRSGLRDGMVKIKHHRTADCVVGGLRFKGRTKTIGSLLLGVYGRVGLLNHIGFCSSLTAARRSELTKLVDPLLGGTGFDGKRPGGPSRWSTKRSSEWTPLKPKLVIEVIYDHFTGDRFRHGTKFLRFRPDKRPRQCTFEQIDQSKGSIMSLLRA